MKVDQPRGRGGEGGGAVDPRETESMAWPLLLRVCADIVEFLLNFRPLFERSFFFFFSSFPKNREIPFNSLLENEPPSWDIVAPLAQFFLVKGPFDFSFLPSEIFFFIFIRWRKKGRYSRKERSVYFICCDEMIKIYFGFKNCFLFLRILNLGKIKKKKLGVIT